MANEIRVEKCFYDLNEYMDYSGFLTQAEVPYLVFGVEDELAALNAVREASPEKLENLTRQTLEISERINLGGITYEKELRSANHPLSHAGIHHRHLQRGRHAERNECRVGWNT